MSGLPQGDDTEAERGEGDSLRPQGAPPGQRCAQHPEREAHVTCPRCKRHHCIACFQLALGICDDCLRRDPAAAAEPMPFEDRSLSISSRVLGTMVTALRPVRSAPAFATDNRGDALRFALWTTLPLAFLAGIVPHTRTLMFAGGFRIEVLGTPTPDALAVALDVVRAGLIQVALTLAHFVALYLPYDSLVRSHAGDRAATHAQRALLYRIWLSPFGLLLLMIASYAVTVPAPPEGAEAVPVPVLVGVAYMLKLVTEVLLMLAMGFAARLACGLSVPWAFIVVVVPAAVSFFVGHAGAELLNWALPAPGGTG